MATDTLADGVTDLGESAGGIIANAYGGDWELASEASVWKSAAERWRDKYHEKLRKEE